MTFSPFLARGAFARLALASIACLFAVFAAPGARAQEEHPGAYFARDALRQAALHPSNVKIRPVRRAGARAGMGVSAAAADGATHELIEIASRYLGMGNITGFRGPWCGAFAAMVARKAGVTPPEGYLQARRWANAGRRLPGPRVGAVAVARNHVGYVQAVVPGGVILLSGNYSRRVASAFYPSGRFIAFVEL